MNRERTRTGRVTFGAQNPLLRSIHLNEAPTIGLEVLNDPITGQESQPELQRKGEKLYATVRDMAKHTNVLLAEKARIAADLETFRKAGEKIEDAKLKAEQALELARAGGATVPDGKLSRRAGEFIRSLARGPKPDRELCELARVQNMDPVYFNLVSQSSRAVREMGAPEEVDRELARLRQLNDVIFMLNKYFSVRDPGTYLEMGGMKGLAVWKEWEELCKRVRFADLAEGGATTGGAWVPTIWSGNLIQLVQILARCANYFETFPMQSNLQKGFVEGADAEAYYIAEGASITQTDFTTFDATWTAKKLAARIITSREVTQDSAVPFVQEIERKLAKAQARTLELIILSGQATGSTAGNPGSLDTGVTIHATNGDPRLFANGLRYWHAQTGQGVVDASGGLTIEKLAKLRGPMGAYGVDPAEMVWLCSAWGSAHLLTVRTEDGRPVFLGPERDSPPGTIGTLLGSDICMSAYVPDNMNANGVIDGAGTTTAIYYPNAAQFKIGERLGIIVEASTHEKFSTDQIVFKAIRRLDFQPVRTPSATDPMVGAIGNLPLS